MYAKLSLRNAKRSMMDYLIYVVTLTLSISLFYGLLSLSSSYYAPLVSAQFSLAQIYTVLRYATYVISAIMIILVNQVNKYMIKRRKREFATYVLLGMKQTQIAFLFFIETLVMLFVSIFLGIIGGTLFSQVLTTLILSYTNSELSLQFMLYPDTTLQTVLFFIIIFLIVGLFNIRRLQKLKLIDMLNDDKKSEVQFARGPWFYLSLAAFSVLCYVSSYLLIRKFIDLYSLRALELQDKNKPLLLGIICLVLGTYALFYSMGYLLVAAKRNFLNWKYKNTNLFLIGNLLAKLNTTSIMMATITLTLTVSACCFVMGPVISEWSKGNIEHSRPFDLQVDTVYNSISNVEDIPEIDYREVYEYIQDSEYGIKDSIEFETYFLKQADFYERRKYNFPALAIALSDYNHLRERVGYSEVVLGEKEFTTHWERSTSQSDIDDFLVANPELQVNDVNLKLSDQPYYKEFISAGIFNGYTYHLIVLPDEACEGLLVATDNFYVNTSKAMSYDFASNLTLSISSWFREANVDLYTKSEREAGKEFKDFLDIRNRIEDENMSASISLVSIVIGLYVGTLLLLLCLTFLALQQLSDSLERKERFHILRKLGVDAAEINKLIFKQIAIYFTVPLVMAMVAFSFGLYQFMRFFQGLILLFVGNQTFVFILIASLFMVGLIYISYFVTTYWSFKRNIEKAAK